MISPAVIYLYVANKQPSQWMNSAAVSMLGRPHTERAPEETKKEIYSFPLIGGLIFTVCQSGNWNGNLNEFHTRNHKATIGIFTACCGVHCHADLKTISVRIYSIGIRCCFIGKVMGLLYCFHSNLLRRPIYFTFSGGSGSFECFCWCWCLIAHQVLY